MTGVSEQWRLGYRPALDGVRGIAIALVLGSHAIGRENSAGAVGVTVFFALSGFLITTLLLEERRDAGSVSLRGFYARRARRLLPALGAYLGVFFVLTTAGLWVIDFSPLHYLGPLLYVENWLMIAAGGAPSITAITWSLSIEEQFYLLWPILMLTTLGWWGRRGLAGLALLGVLTAPLLRLAMWDGGDGWWRVYYGTDTRMDSLLLGCLLAVAVTTGRRGARFATTAGPAAIAMLAALVWWDGPVIKYLMTPAVASAAACLLIIAVLNGSCGWLAWSPLRWLGRRSYALYLWHYPLFALTWIAPPDPLRIAVALGLSLVLTELSWRFVERPVMARRISCQETRNQSSTTFADPSPKTRPTPT